MGGSWPSVAQQRCHLRLRISDALPDDPAILSKSFRVRPAFSVRA